MKITLTLFKNLIRVSFIVAMLSYVANSEEINQTNTYKTCYTENCISTPDLQKEVERLSNEGKLPFEMGLELIKRWSAKA